MIQRPQDTFQQALARIPEMFSQSQAVITSPSIENFERFEKSGGMINAGVYIGVAAIVSGLIGLVGGIGGLIIGFILPIVSFFIFTGLVYYIAQQQGGTGNFDEVAYTFSLFQAPLSIVGAILGLIPVLGLLASLLIAIAGIYFGYLSVQSSMNIRGNTAIITLVGAMVASFVVNLVLVAVLTPIFLFL